MFLNLLVDGPAAVFVENVKPKLQNVVFVKARVSAHHLFVWNDIMTTTMMIRMIMIMEDNDEDCTQDIV